MRVYVLGLRLRLRVYVLLVGMEWISFKLVICFVLLYFFLRYTYLFDTCFNFLL